MNRPLWKVVCVGLMLWVASDDLVKAADTPGVQLLQPDTFDGWQHSAEPVRGWTIKDGRLTGSEGATPLLGGWTLGDFELRFDWSVSKHGKLIVKLPKMPVGDGMTLSLAEGKSIDLVTVGNRVVVSDKQIPATKSGAHTAVLKRDGEKYSLAIDGKAAGSGSLPADLRLGLMLSVAEGQASISNIRLIEPAGEPIFNGKDLTGWWTPGNKNAWVARDGEIVLAARGGNYLRTEKLHANYTFSFEYRTPKNTNSGIGIRTARNGWPSGDGMELQIHTSPGLGYGSMMSLYRNVPPLARGEKIEDWNRVVIKADGRMITAWVNGVMTQHCNTAWEAELKHRHLTGWIGFQDHGRSIRIRNLNLLAAPDGLGMDGWYFPRQLPMGRNVLDRLMNIDVLAWHTGTTSGLVVKEISDAGQHVVADLVGPGALVRVVTKSPKGKLSFYFDDEKTPRLECPAAQLSGNIPKVIQQGPLLLTYVGYRRRLRIVANDAAGSTVTLEYITFLRDDAVTTWSKTDDAIPRGVLAAIDYRLHQHRHGGFRQHDPYLRPSKTNLSIPAGEGVTVISHRAPGLVHFVQFHGDKRHLGNDNLWIEVRVDGEAEPSLAAPLRYYFAPLAEGGNFANFVFTERGGQVCRLGIPFSGGGIRIDLRNRGKQTIRGVGLTASIQSERGYSPTRRLHGVFLKASDKLPDVFQVRGAGRWVGLVTQTRGEDPIRFKELRVDGQAQPAWSGLPFDAFLASPAPNQNFRGVLSGRQGTLAWRYSLLAPVSFEKSIELSVDRPTSLGDRLVLFYMK